MTYFYQKRTFCNVCNIDLTDRGDNWRTHYYFNHPNSYPRIREEYQLLKGCK